MSRRKRGSKRGGRKRGSKRGGRKRGAAAHIPTDSLEEILHRLPSKDLLKFKTVCKDWLRLISSPEFIQKHLERSKAECNRARLLTLLRKNSGLEVIDMEENIAKRIRLRNVKSFLGSCDGLVLCRLVDGKIAAVNPSTGEYEYVVRTPNPYISNYDEGLVFTCSWFGRHPFTGEYVLAIIAHLVGSPNRAITFKVYSLSSNINNSLLSSSAHHLVNETVWALGKTGIILHGRLHCAGVVPIVGDASAPFEIIILVHSFQTNSNIERMRCPANSCSTTLGDVDGCLSIICTGEEVCELWMMKEYGVEESWTKFANINANRFIDIFIPLKFCPNGDYLIVNSKRSWITKYSLRNNGKVKFTKSRHRYEAIACIDSLVSPHSLVLGEKEELAAVED